LNKNSNQVLYTLAFSNTKTAAAYSISYPLTIHFGMPHGIASSITILELLKINRKSIEPIIGKVIKKICFLIIN